MSKAKTTINPSPHNHDQAKTQMQITSSILSIEDKPKILNIPTLGPSNSNRNNDCTRGADFNEESVPKVIHTVKEKVNQDIAAEEMLFDDGSTNNCAGLNLRYKFLSEEKK